jgi:hypothetical protein
MLLYPLQKLVDIIFSGILSMETQCLHCNNTSRVFQRHIDLGFPIPTYQEYQDNLNQSNVHFVKSSDVFHQK